MSFPVGVWPAIALAIVVGLLWALQHLIRSGRLVLPGAPAPGRSLAVVEVVSLDSRRRVQLVRCGARHVVILTGGPQDVLLGWIGEDTSCGR